MFSEKYTKEQVNNVKSIGFIIRTPVLRALKNIFSDASITAIIYPICKQVLDYNYFMDDIMVVNKLLFDENSKDLTRKIKLFYEDESLYKQS